MLILPTIGLYTNDLFTILLISSAKPAVIIPVNKIFGEGRTITFYILGGLFNNLIYHHLYNVPSIKYLAFFIDSDRFCVLCFLSIPKHYLQYGPERMAELPGFEPRPEESKSYVLPLHHSSRYKTPCTKLLNHLSYIPINAV